MKFLLCILLLTACSVSREDKSELPEHSVVPVKKVKKKLWEFWKPGYSVDGEALTQPEILEADRLYEAGNKKTAIDLLQEINLSDYPQKIEYNVLYRIWSYQLALPDPQYALSNIRSYCQRNIPAEQMPDYFAMLLGFSHGGLKNVKKSIAWFTYAIENAKIEKVKNISLEAVKLLLNSLDDIDMEFAKTSVNPDILRLVENELQLRTLPGYVYNKNYGYFWETKASTLVRDTIITNDADAVNLILPLIGKFKSYGASTRDGMKLALDSSAIKYNILEGSDPSTTLNSFNRLSNPNSLLVGPAIASVADEVAQKANEKNLSTIILTKNSDFTPTGVVFRFAPTLDQQVDSLLRIVNSKFGFTRYGIVYPENTGKEVLTAFRKKLVEFNLSNTASFAYDGSFSAFNGLGQTIQDRGIQAVLFAGSLADLVSFQSQQTPDFRSQVKVLGLLNFDEPEILENSFLDGTIFLRGFRKDLSFETKYSEQFKKQPDFFAYQGYDLGMIISDIYSKKAGAASYSDAIRQLGISGLTGVLSVEGNEIKRAFTVAEIRNNTIVDLKR